MTPSPVQDASPAIRTAPVQPPRSSRRRWRAAGSAVIGALAVASAGIAGTASAGTTEPVGAAPAGTLDVGVVGLPPTQGNPYGALGSPSIYTWSALFDALTLVDANGQAAPALATEWESVDDVTWRFTLRDGVTFSNGEPFDAAAVVAAWDYLSSEEGKASVVGRELVTISSITAVDPLTVEIATAGPDPVLPNRVSAMFIVAPQQWADLGPDGFAAEPVGTGPFAVDSWGTTEVSLVANTESWRQPGVESVVLTALPEPASRVQALQSGQIDIALGVSPDQISAIEESGASVDVRPASQVMSLTFISTDPESPFADQRVRVALNLAVDRQAIVDGLMAGLGAPASQGATPAANGYDESLAPIAFDPERATELLAEAGYPDGFSFVAEVVVGSFPADAEIYQAMAENLRQINVEVELRQLQFSEWLEKYNNGTWEGEAFGLSWNTAPYLDAIRPYNYASCLKEPAFFCDDAQLALIEEAGATLDPEARRAVLAELAVLTVENPPSLFLVEQIDLHGISAEVTGFENVNRFIPYEKITVA